MASKCPKARHYGGSEALQFRVASGVLQTNEGHQYVGNVCLEAGLSPGSHCLAEGERQDRRRQRSRIRKSSCEFKRRRLFLAANRSTQTASNELCEGMQTINLIVLYFQLEIPFFFLTKTLSVPCVPFLPCAF